MIIGEEHAVDELWAEARARMPEPRDDRPGQPVYVLDEAPEPGETGLRAATLADLDLLVPACAEAHREEIGIDPLRRDPKGSAGGRVPRSRRAARGSGSRTASSASRPRRRRGRRRPCSSSRSGSTRRLRNRGYAKRAMRDLCRLLLARVPTVCLFVRPENDAAIRVYDGIGMQRTIAYRSLIF